MSTDTIKKRAGRKPVMTPQRKELILRFIHEYRRIKEVSPTHKEIALGIGYNINAAGTAFTLVDELVQEGWLRHANANSSRSLIPIYPPETVYAEITDPELKSILKRQKNLRILRRL